MLENEIKKLNKLKELADEEIESARNIIERIKVISGVMKKKRERREKR